ncbi:hypothetical protein LALA110947_11170 [Lactococcus laudensis]
MQNHRQTKIQFESLATPTGYSETSIPDVNARADHNCFLNE